MKGENMMENSADNGNVNEGVQLDERYKVRAYYDMGYRGLADDLETDDWFKASMYAHEKSMEGLSVEITDTETGKEARIDPDRYHATFEARNGEFPVDPDTMLIHYGDEAPPEDDGVPITYEELIEFAKENYTKGGDSVYECWDEQTFNTYVEEFGPITKKSAFEMFNMLYDVDRDRRGWY